MKTVGNLIWMIFGGLLSALGYFILGIILSITLIGIPFGRQCFKISSLYLWPFGKNISIDFDAHPIANIIWLVFVGWEMCLANLIMGVLMCVTIIGIPFGKQWFKLAKLSLIPFGAKVN